MLIESGSARAARAPTSASAARARLLISSVYAAVRPAMPPPTTATRTVGALSPSGTPNRDGSTTFDAGVP